MDDDVKIVTDHSAVKALLANPTLSGKHARWWLQVYDSGVRKVEIVYRPGRENSRAGRENSRADALSHNPTEAPKHHVLDVQVVAVSCGETDITTLLQDSPREDTPCDFDKEQEKDPELCQLRQFLQFGILPDDEVAARTIAAQALNFEIVDNLLYYMDKKRGGRRRAVVPSHLRKSIMTDCHTGRMVGHFSRSKVPQPVGQVPARCPVGV